MINTFAGSRSPKIAPTARGRRRIGDPVEAIGPTVRALGRIETVRPRNSGPQGSRCRYSRQPESGPGDRTVVAVGKGRTINLVCLGHGSPTVVLTAGLGNWSLAWGLVQRPLALKIAGIRGPYVMVGHSLGAYEALRFTDRHRQSVIGMILVDPAIPDQQALMERIAPLFRAKASAVDEQTVKQLQHCAAGLRGGTLALGAPQLEQCTAAPAVPAVFPRLRAAIARLNADPARLLTQASTVKEFDSDAAHDSREVMNARRRYGDMPLIVLTAGRDESAMSFLVRDAPPAEVVELHRQVARFLRDAWGPAHDAYAALSARGRNRLVPDSGHAIQIDRPAVVVSAVIEVLDEIRSARGRRLESSEQSRSAR